MSSLRSTHRTPRTVLVALCAAAMTASLGAAAPATAAPSNPGAAPVPRTSAAMIDVVVSAVADSTRLPWLLPPTGTGVAAVTGPTAASLATTTAGSAKTAAAAKAPTRAKVTKAQLRAARRAAGKGGEAATRALHALPRSKGIRLLWDEPALGSHLGGVWKGDTSSILLNSRRLRSDPSRARDVVRHEIVHIYQGRIMRKYHLTWSQLNRKMAGAFGPNAMERSADCVARHFGARWTGYTSACSGASKRVWVRALVAGTLPKR
ncbi:hypothetical protein [Cellulomonas edaphi]|uniref:DUF4157 domain-containing protein n=1 Tax=Cellulomonas edaphi TaxID=3053468 RepID=A0ABT7S645_9CELL|nr:hypothetical protein [Cellulomons edaphi]MDM7830979.1 hypothetical protein [Cellulomons edaphi]